MRGKGEEVCSCGTALRGLGRIVDGVGEWRRAGWMGVGACTYASVTQASTGFGIVQACRKQCRQAGVTNSG